MLKSSLRELKELTIFFFSSFTEGHVAKASGAEGEMGEASRKET